MQGNTAVTEVRITAQLCPVLSKAGQRCAGEQSTHPQGMGGLHLGPLPACHAVHGHAGPQHIGARLLPRQKPCCTTGCQMRRWSAWQICADVVGRRTSPHTQH